MKILVLTNLYPPHHLGGYELICQTVADTLRDRQHRVLILTSDHRASGARAGAADEAVERSLKIIGLYDHPWYGIWKLRQIEAHNNGCLRSALRRHQPDLVYVWNMGGLSKSMLFTLERLGVPTVFYISDHWIARGLQSDVWLRWWNRTDGSLWQRYLRTAWTLLGGRRRWTSRAPTASFDQLSFRRIYFCSRALRDFTVRAGFRVAHGAVIYCPVHSRFFSEAFLPTQREPRRLLYAGRLAEDKGVMTALQALLLLRDRLKPSLTLCGQGDPAYEAKLRGFADQHRLDVHFTSADLQEMPAVYRRHDLLLFTSEWAEPFALTPLEAMACGVPVIGTMTGGSAELFRNKQNALTYRAGHAAELADRIEQFAASPALRQRCALTAFVEARERYAPSVIVDQIEVFLRETLETWPSAPEQLESNRPLTATASLCGY